VFRRIWRPPTRRKPGETPLPTPVVGHTAVDVGTVGRIVKARAAAAGFDPRALGGHSLKRGALTPGMDRGVHPTRLKQLGRHKSYAVLDEYLELGDPFDSHPLNGVLQPQLTGPRSFVWHAVAVAPLPATARRMIGRTFPRLP